MAIVSLNTSLTVQSPVLLDFGFTGLTLEFAEVISPFGFSAAGLTIEKAREGKINFTEPPFSVDFFGNAVVAISNPDDEFIMKWFTDITGIYRIEAGGSGIFKGNLILDRFGSKNISGKCEASDASAPIVIETRIMGRDLLDTAGAGNLDINIYAVSSELGKTPFNDSRSII